MTHDLAAITRRLSIPTDREGAASPPRPALRFSSPLRRLLIANDQMDLRPHLAHTLASTLRCAVESAGSFEAALESVRSHRPDAVLLDLPGPRGVDIVRALRRSPGGEQLVIVVLRNLGGADEWRGLRDAGADARFAEPVEIGLLARSLLGLTMTRKAADGLVDKTPRALSQR